MAVVIDGSAGVTTNSGAVYNGLQTGTSITLTNQTAPEFTSIPSWVRRITVQLSGVGTSSTGVPLVQLGDSGGYETSGYLSAGANTGTGTNQTSNIVTFTSGYGLSGTWASTYRVHGNVILTLQDSSTNTWVLSYSFGNSAAANAFFGGGSKALSATLDRIRLYIDGTQTFNAGTINIIYE
jgi:hypothetical protein